MHTNDLLANKLGALALHAVDDLVAGLAQSESAGAALLTLFHRGALAASDLAPIIGLTQSATVRLIDRLESQGLVRREPAPGRAVPLGLTVRGRRRAATGLACLRSAIRYRGARELWHDRGVQPHQHQSRGALRHRRQAGAVVQRANRGFRRAKRCERPTR